MRSTVLRKLREIEQFRSELTLKTPDCTCLHFSGAAHEDYVKFNDKIVKAFRRNGVGKSDQVEKLRKTLSGFALSLVPESTESIDKALDVSKSFRCLGNEPF